eukprot:CAMPEP_0179054322 /NCGR_PEP_ID=MMETSP0796-20121207/22725_1 /TAXON_ID=73915 /ORGANISM="Pyrodinium bahamense, Strain pbaha01" /LENGTH=41 /DNA_ID= /DNA_START= /DNA_END= /DNA_ORIENTATION=
MKLLRLAQRGRGVQGHTEGMQRRRAQAIAHSASSVGRGAWH